MTSPQPPSGPIGRLLTPLLDRVTSLQRRVNESPTFHWATVTSASPLRVRIDGSTAPLDATPDLAVPAPGEGARVLVMFQNGRWAVVAGGSPEPYFRCRPLAFSGPGQDWSLTSLVQSSGITQLSDTRVRIDEPGVYFMHAEALHQSVSSGGRVDIEIRKSDARIQGTITAAPANNSGWRTGGTSTLEVVSEDDTQEHYFGVTSVIHSSGTATLSPTWSRFTIHRVSTAV